jgi:hypothetical protein
MREKKKYFDCFFIIIFICSNLFGMVVEFSSLRQETRLGNVPRVPSSLKISRVWRVKEKERKWKATAAELRDKLPTTERIGILACGPLAQLGGLDTKKSYFQLSM